MIGLLKGGRLRVRPLEGARMVMDGAGIKTVAMTGLGFCNEVTCAD